MPITMVSETRVHLQKLLWGRTCHHSSRSFLVQFFFFFFFNSCEYWCLWTFSAQGGRTRYLLVSSPSLSLSLLSPSISLCFYFSLSVPLCPSDHCFLWSFSLREIPFLFDDRTKSIKNRSIIGLPNIHPNAFSMFYMRRATGVEGGCAVLC